MCSKLRLLFPKASWWVFGGQEEAGAGSRFCGAEIQPGIWWLLPEELLGFWPGWLFSFFIFYFFLKNTERPSFFTLPACSPVPCTAWEERCSNSPFPAAFLFLCVTLQNLCCFGQMPAQGAEELGSGSSTSLLCGGGTHGCWGSALPGTPTAMLEGKARRDHNRGRRSGWRGFHLSSPDLLPQHLPPKTPSGP